MPTHTQHSTDLGGDVEFTSPKHPVLQSSRCILVHQLQHGEVSQFGCTVWGGEGRGQEGRGGEWEGRGGEWEGRGGEGEGHAIHVRASDDVVTANAHSRTAFLWSWLKNGGTVSTRSLRGMSRGSGSG